MACAARTHSASPSPPSSLARAKTLRPANGARMGSGRSLSRSLRGDPSRGSADGSWPSAGRAWGRPGRRRRGRGCPRPTPPCTPRRPGTPARPRPRERRARRRRRRRRPPSRPPRGARWDTRRRRATPWGGRERAPRDPSRGRGRRRARAPGGSRAESRPREMPPCAAAHGAGGVGEARGEQSEGVHGTSVPAAALELGDDPAGTRGDRARGEDARRLLGKGEIGRAPRRDRAVLVSEHDVVALARRRHANGASPEVGRRPELAHERERARGRHAAARCEDRAHRRLVLS